MVFLQKIKDLGILGTGDIVGSALGAIFWFYLASQIEPEQYGQIQWFIGIAGAMSYVALFGSQNTIIVFAAKNLKIQSTLYFISLIASIVLSTIVIVIFPSFYQINGQIKLVMVKMERILEKIHAMILNSTFLSSDNF